MNDDVEIMNSPLSQRISDGGISVDVEIYCASDSNWILEIIDDSGASIVWEETFSTDQSAFAELNREIEAKGLSAIIREADEHDA